MPPPIQHTNSPKPRVCSEFYAVRELETQFFKEIQHTLKRESYRTMALGYSLAHMSMGYCDVFYKANVKLWDVIAPLGILALTQSEYWDIELMTYDGHSFSPFSNERAFIDYLNKRHQDNCRRLINDYTQIKPRIYFNYSRDCSWIIFINRYYYKILFSY